MPTLIGTDTTDETFGFQLTDIPIQAITSQFAKSTQIVNCYKWILSHCRQYFLCSIVRFLHSIFIFLYSFLCSIGGFLCSRWIFYHVFHHLGVIFLHSIFYFLHYVTRKKSIFLPPRYHPSNSAFGILHVAFVSWN